MAAEPFDGICTLVDDLVLLGGVLFLDDQIFEEIVDLLLLHEQILQLLVVVLSKVRIFFVEAVQFETVFLVTFAQAQFFLCPLLNIPLLRRQATQIQ